MQSIKISTDSFSETAQRFLGQVGGAYFKLDPNGTERPTLNELCDSSGAPLQNVPPTVKSELRAAALARGWVDDLFTVELPASSTAPASAGNGAKEIKRADFDAMPPADQRKAMRAGAKLID